MYYIQDKEGWYFCGLIDSTPVWCDDIRDAKQYASQDDTASDERALDHQNVLYWVLMK